MRYFMMVIGILVFSVAAVFAQIDDGTVPVITVDNTQQLQSVQHIDFADDLVMLSGSDTDDVTVLETDFITGYFNMNDAGTEFIAVDSSGQMFRFDDSGVVLLSRNLTENAPDDALFVFQDADITDSAGLVTYQIDSDQHFLYHRITDDSVQFQHLVLDTLEYAPLQVWLNCDTTDNSNETLPDCVGWFNTQTISGEQYVIQLPVMQTSSDDLTPEPVTEDALTILPYAPADDPDAVVRVGRIPPPYAVTSSEAGEVKLWNLETGEVLYTVNNDTGLPSVFGGINHTVTHLVWRDNPNETLYLLNFDTGENREIAPLFGEYAQWLFLSNDASVIFGVNMDFQPEIAVWNTTTGERITPGEHRSCGRPQPDTARLSADGTTLVVGCDTGLDIWRVVQD